MTTASTLADGFRGHRGSVQRSWLTATCAHGYVEPPPPPRTVGHPARPTAHDLAHRDAAPSVGKIGQLQRDPGPRRRPDLHQQTSSSPETLHSSTVSSSITAGQVPMECRMRVPVQASSQPPRGSGCCQRPSLSRSILWPGRPKRVGGWQRCRVTVLVCPSFGERCALGSADEGRGIKRRKGRAKYVLNPARLTGTGRIGRIPRRVEHVRRRSDWRRERRELPDRLPDDLFLMAPASQE